MNKKLVFAMVMVPLATVCNAVCIGYAYAGAKLQKPVDDSVEKVISTNFPVSDILPAERKTNRRDIVNKLDNALETRQFLQAAYLNSQLSQEAFRGVYSVLKAWEKTIDPDSKLLPTALPDRKYAYWNAPDTASDLLPFLILASYYLDRNNMDFWVNIIVEERKICGKIPCTVKFRPTKVIKEDLSVSIFGASEYAKDGLLAISERLGRGEWFSRMEEIMDAIIKLSAVPTKTGNIPSSESEVNGNMLQVLSRLYWATGKKQYLDMAERIAEAYLFEVLPRTEYLHPSSWDFTNNRFPESCRTNFRDHGNEIIPGLAELYLLEKVQGRPQAGRYRQPLKKFLDKVLKTARTPDGLWYNKVSRETKEIMKTAFAGSSGITDTWGYLLNAYKTFDLAEGTHIYDKEIKRTMRAAASRKSFKWERQAQDGYADSLESMLYQLPWFDIPQCRLWLDDEMEILLSKQQPNGFIEQIYLDGNWIRTVLLYALYKTQGITAQPWDNSIQLGACYDNTKKELYLYIAADNQWKGILKFDGPRYRQIWSLPFEYPRLNSSPQWFIAQPQKTYTITNLGSGEKTLVTGNSLSKGLEISLIKETSSLNLKISEDAA